MIQQIYICLGYILAALVASMIPHRVIVSMVMYVCLVAVVTFIIVSFHISIGIIGFCGLFISGVVLFFIKRSENDKDKKAEDERNAIYRVPLKAVGGKTHYIKDANKGIFIAGASGSGKTESILKDLLVHYNKYDFAGVIYDYKDFELTEIAGTIFKDRDFNVFAIHDACHSVRLNPIDPKYLVSENAVRGIVKNLFLNLKGLPKGDSFFRDAAEGLMVAMIWRMKSEFPELCNLPFLVAILLQVDALHKPKVPYGYLIDFVQAEPEYQVKASTFLTGVVSDRQTAGVYATLTDAIQVLDSPNIVYLLSGCDIDLNITDNQNRQILSVVNKPGVEAVALTPLNAMIIDIIINIIPRGNKQSFVLLEEAPTIKLYGLEQMVATLRAYGVSFVYVMQGLPQGKLQWSGQDMYIKSTVTNLSAQFFGKVNDPDTGEYFEKFFAFIKEKQQSYSSGMSDRRTTTSYKDQRKVRASAFQKFKSGQFIMMSEGIDKNFRFKYEKIPKYKSPVRRMITDEELRQYSKELYDLAANFIQGGYNKYPYIVERFKQIQK